MLDNLNFICMIKWICLMHNFDLWGGWKPSHIKFLLCEFFDDANSSIFEQDGYRTDYRNQMPNNSVRLLIYSSEYDAEWHFRKQMKSLIKWRKTESYQNNTG